MDWNHGMDSKSVCSRRSISSYRSVRSTMSSRSRSRAPKNSATLAKGMDELDFTIAAVVSEREDTIDNNTGGSGKFGNGQSASSNSSACLITNIMQTNIRSRRDTPSKAASRQLSSNKSISGRSIRSTREAREIEIARTVLRQAKNDSGVLKNKDQDQDNDATSAASAASAASIVSNFSTVEILDDLTDNEDTLSVYSTRSRRRRRGRSRSKNQSRSSSTSTFNPFDSPRERRGRSKSRTSTPSGLIVAESKHESERLYSAFMKNLSREEMIAHDTKVLSTSSNIRAELSAARIGRNSDDNKVNSSGKKHEDWFSSEDALHASFDDGTTKSVPSRITGKTKKPTSSNASSTPESISFFDTDSNVFRNEGNSCSTSQTSPQRSLKSTRLISPYLEKRNRRKTKMNRIPDVSDRKKKLHNEESFDSKQKMDVNIEAFASFDNPSVSASPRYTFSEKTSDKSKKLGKKKAEIDSPARDAIARRQKALPKTSVNSFVPQNGSKVTLSKSTPGKWTEFSSQNGKKDYPKSIVMVKPGENMKHPEEANEAGKLSSESVQNVTDFFNDDDKLHQSDDSYSSNFFTDPFNMSTSQQDGRQNTEPDSSFQGFGKSKKFESISSDWETDENGTSSTDLFAKTPSNMKSKRTLSDGSPTGVMEFDSENEKFPETQLFSDAAFW